MAQTANTLVYGGRANNDNTIGNARAGVISYALATGIDTVTIAPNASVTYVKCATSITGAQVALNDSVAFRLTLPANYLQGRFQYGSEVTFTFLADGTNRKVKFVGSNWVLGTAITVAANKRAQITFVWDGARLIEKSRFIQP